MAEESKSDLSNQQQLKPESLSTLPQPIAPPNGTLRRSRVDTTSVQDFIRNHGDATLADVQAAFSTRLPDTVYKTYRRLRADTPSPTEDQLNPTAQCILDMLRKGKATKEIMFILHKEYNIEFKSKLVSYYKSKFRQWGISFGDTYIPDARSQKPSSNKHPLTHPTRALKPKRKLAPAPNTIPPVAIRPPIEKPVEYPRIPSYFTLTTRETRLLLNTFLSGTNRSFLANIGKAFAYTLPSHEQRNAMKTILVNSLSTDGDRQYDMRISPQYSPQDADDHHRYDEARLRNLAGLVREIIDSGNLDRIFSVNPSGQDAAKKVISWFSSLAAKS